MTISQDGKYVLYSDYSKHIRKCVDLIDSAFPNGEIRQMAIQHLDKMGIDHGLK